jgi:membrane protein
MRVFLRLLHGAMTGAFHDNALSVAKGATYSFLLCFFPALFFFATVWARSDLFPGLFVQFGPVLSRVLPGPALTLVESAIAGVSRPSLRVEATAAVVAAWAGGSLMVSWMEGFQAAYNAPPYPMVRQRMIALFLAVVSVVPLIAATLMIWIGGSFESWLTARYGIFIRQFLVLWDVSRWLIAIAALTLIFTLIYRLGVNRLMTWASVAPGALVATLLWMVSTLGFGIYVRRYAEYSTLYGSLAAVVVLMVWMYLLSLAVLVGAEFNSELALHRFSTRQ